MSAYKHLGFAPVNRQARHEFWRSYRQRKLFWVAMRFLLAAVLVPLFAWLWLAQ